MGGGQYQKFADGNSQLKLFTPFNFRIGFQNYCSSDVQQSLDGVLAIRVREIFILLFFFSSNQKSALNFQHGIILAFGLWTRNPITRSWKDPLIETMGPSEFWCH